MARHKKTPYQRRNGRNARHQSHLVTSSHSAQIPTTARIAWSCHKHLLNSDGMSCAVAPKQRKMNRTARPGGSEQVDPIETVSLQQKSHIYQEALRWTCVLRSLSGVRHQGRPDRIRHPAFHGEHLPEIQLHPSPVSAASRTHYPSA